MEPESAPVVYAPLLHRVIARLLDLGVHAGAVIYTAFWFLFGIAILAPDRLEPLTEKLGEGPLFNIILGLGAMVYHTCMEGTHGSTVGKRLLGITVIGEEGGPCSLRQGWIRSLSTLIDGILLGLVGLANANNSPQKQRLGDEWADTIVVRTSSLPAALRQPGRQLFASFCTAFACDCIVVALGCALSLR